MDYSPTLCFVGFNSKKRKFNNKEEKKSNCSSLCRDKRPSEWLRNNVRTVFLLSQHKGLSIEEKLCRDKWQCVATKHE